MSKNKDKPKKRTLEFFNSQLEKGPSLRFASFYVCLALVAITWIVFGQTVRHDFVNFDDPAYVYENPRITPGLTADRLIDAFTHTHARNWHPLTTISHMLDCQLYGLQAGWHHFTNVLLHTVAVLLLFLVLNQMTGGPSRTGSIWQSAFVASLFAIHPLHVESVAWVSERKDVLSAVFFMLTLGAYVRYVHKPSVGRYLTVALFFALGLMSKPMLVTLPFVLLLFDYWPLGRIRSQTSDVRRQRPGVSGPVFANQPSRKATARQTVVSGLVAEKIPLFALSALSCAATLLAQVYSTEPIEQLPFMWRLNTAAVSYVAYIWQMFWPARLAAFYPHPNDQLPFWQVLLAIAFLISVSLLAIVWKKKRPYIFTGWFWYVGMLVPVIGLLQAGEQARADRYTYLPQIGLYVLITWGITDLMALLMMRSSGSRLAATGLQPVTLGSRRVPPGSPHGRGYKLFCAAFAAAIIIALTWRAFVQTSHWKNSEMLWNHTLAVTNNNDMAHNCLGNLFLRRGELDSAISHFEKALEIRSGTAAAHYNFGGALIENNLGAALARKGRLTEAIGHYEKAMKLRPDYGDPYLNLGRVLFQQGRTDEAIAQWQRAVATQPNDAGFHTILGKAFLERGLQKDATAEYEHASRISPHEPLAGNNFAWLLATSFDASIRDGNRAIKVAKQTVQISGGKDPTYLRTLAAAYAEASQFSEAIKVAQQGQEIATSQGNLQLANVLQGDIALYQIGLPLRQKFPEK
jgi:tetratricopeptide (TPR) repeat protein